MRIDQPGGPHHLLHDLRLVLLLVFGGRRGDEDRPPHHALELVEAQRAIVERRRQTKTVVDQVFLARTVAAIHAADLRYGDVALVDDHQRVARQIIEQRRRRLAGCAPREVTRVVLDALAEAHLVQHLEIEPRALLDALAFDELVVLLKPLDALRKLRLDRVDRPQRGRARRHVMARRIDRVAPHPLQDVAGERIEDVNAFDLVVEQCHAHGVLRVLRREDVEDVSAHPEHAASELQFVALVLHLAQTLNGVALRRASRARAGAGSCRGIRPDRRYRRCRTRSRR